MWMTPSEAPQALQASACSKLLNPLRASCGISARRGPRNPKTKNGSLGHVASRTQQWQCLCIYAWCPHQQNRAHGPCRDDEQPFNKKYGPLIHLGPNMRPFQECRGKCCARQIHSKQLDISVSGVCAHNDNDHRHHKTEESHLKPGSTAFQSDS